MTGLLTLLGPPGGRSPVFGLVLFCLAVALVVAAVGRVTQEAGLRDQL